MGIVTSDDVGGALFQPGAGDALVVALVPAADGDGQAVSEVLHQGALEARVVLPRALVAQAARFRVIRFRAVRAQLAQPHAVVVPLAGPRVGLPPAAPALPLLQVAPIRNALTLPED